MNKSLSFFYEYSGIDLFGTSGKNTQSDIFNTDVVKLTENQGASLGAAILVANGCGWFNNLKDSANHFISIEKTIKPNPENVEKYKKLFDIYKSIYGQTKNINKELLAYR